MKNPDLLYHIFEHHLFSALVEDETSDEFLARVVKEYMRCLSSGEGMIPHEHVESVECDLKDEVLEMLRKKTYGHYSLSEFRKAHRAAPLLKGKHKRKTQRES